MIGKKKEGSGFSDVLMEAGLISSGSLNGVISGKNFSRASNCHKVMFESLSGLLFEAFMKVQDEDTRQKLEDTFACPLESAQVLVTSADAPLVEKYFEFCDSVRDGFLGKTAEFWLSYMDHVSLTLLLTRSVKSNDFH